LKAKRIAGAAVLAVALGIVLGRWVGPGRSSPPVEPPPRRPPPAASRNPEPAAAWPARDPFRYVEQRAPAPATPRVRLPTTPLRVPAAEPSASASPLRLIGLVRQGDRLKAALSLWGETIVLGAGEEARGYKVLSVDEERGVSLKGPDGSELTLRPS
jgi:hypothetical protein